MFFKETGISPVGREDFTKLLSANAVAKNSSHSAMYVCLVVQKLNKLCHTLLLIIVDCVKLNNSCLDERLSTELIKKFIWNKIKNGNKSMQVFENGRFWKHSSQILQVRIISCDKTTFCRGFFCVFFPSFISQWFYVAVSDQVR